jgi:predicted small metal-binding protein
MHPKKGLRVTIVQRTMETGMKRILCGDLVPGCTFKAQAATEADVLSIEVDHVRQVHAIEIAPGFLERARERIEDVDDPSAGVRREAASPG